MSCHTLNIWVKVEREPTGSCLVVHKMDERMDTPVNETPAMPCWFGAVAVTGVTALFTYYLGDPVTVELYRFRTIPFHYLTQEQMPHENESPFFIFFIFFRLVKASRRLPPTWDLAKWIIPRFVWVTHMDYFLPIEKAPNLQSPHVSPSAQSWLTIVFVLCFRADRCFKGEMGRHGEFIVNHII